MNIALWIVAGLLAVAFLAAGLMKLTQPQDKLQANMPWVADFSANAVRGIGAVEVLGAIGLILPGITKIVPILVPLAATGLAITMVLAAAMHLRRGDGLASIVPSVVLFALSVFVAWGRFGPYAF
jgi:uncharacterized membrane protein